MKGLTTAEVEAINAFTAAWNQFVALPRCHPTELQEGIRAIHELQTLISHRAAVRAHPDLFRAVEGFE